MGRSGRRNLFGAGKSEERKSDRNPKSEIRNPKQIQMSKIPIVQTPLQSEERSHKRLFSFSLWILDHSDFGYISDFDLPVSAIGMFISICALPAPGIVHPVIYTGCGRRVFELRIW
jgi:hypothetical protein